MKRFKLTALLLVLISFSYAQEIPQKGAMTFKTADSLGLTNEYLTPKYRSAMYREDGYSAPLFTVADERKLAASCQSMLQYLLTYLKQNGFIWERPTECRNKIYFSKDGGIDYFLYEFTGRVKKRPTKAKQQEFNRLLNLFIKDYKMSYKTSINYSHPINVTYTD